MKWAHNDWNRSDIRLQIDWKVDIIDGEITDTDTGYICTDYTTQSNSSIAFNNTASLAYIKYQLGLSVYESLCLAYCLPYLSSLIQSQSPNNFCTHDLISNMDKQMQWKLNKNRFKFHNHIVYSLLVFVCLCEWYSETGLIHVNTGKQGGKRGRGIERVGKRKLWIRLQIGQETPTNNHVEWDDTEKEKEKESGMMSPLLWLCN